MDSKRRKVSHDYNLRSRDKRVMLRPRNRQRSDTDASTSTNQLEESNQPFSNQLEESNQLSSNQLEVSNQPIRDVAQELQQSKSRSRHRHRKDSTRRHRKSSSVPNKPNGSKCRGKSASNKPNDSSRRRRRRSASNKPNEDASDDIKCVICLDTLNDRRMKLISCGHSFHTKCCNSWLSVNDACPVCRAVVAPKRARLQDMNRERIIDNTPISDIIYFFTLSVVRTQP